MKRTRQATAVAGVATAALALTMTMPGAQARQAPVDKDPVAVQKKDNLPNPLADAQNALRREAIAKLVTGQATTEVRGGQRVIKLAGKVDARTGKKSKDRFVSYPVEREESILTILTDFGTQTDPRTDGSAGPRHNEIPQPVRGAGSGSAADNSTYWVKNFNRSHYRNMMFGDGESFKDFYLKQSNGRFLATGDVSNWVTVPFNEARYGSNDISEADGYWNYVKDTASAWYDAQVAAGKSKAWITKYLKQFDKVDRYDYDGDGNFNEPDGYIDHFQAIHAGEGEEAGGGAEGEDAIWSHRWYAFSTNAGKTGPTGNLLGGVPLGDSGLWIGDYTTEPENGGLGVFSHEFGHDLGLPDLYDTNGGDNGTGFWTLMSAGSWLGHGGNSIGTTPGYMGAWEKLFLGWLDYTVVPYGESRGVKIGPADRDAKNNPQAVVVTLPDKTTTTQYNTPHAGSNEWWSGSSNNRSATLSRSIDLSGAASASVSAYLAHDIEEDYDYLYAEASTDGTSWTTLDSITGSDMTWAQKTWDLSDFAGEPVQFRFRYASDGGYNLKGAFLDDIMVTVDGDTVLTDGAEDGDNGWTVSGWSRIDGSTTVTTPRFYLAENRVYSGYDDTLRTGPYNFGWGTTRPDWVERFPYQNGLLVTYYDGSYADNNTSTHPGGGLVLPVDARPANMVFPDGFQLGNRRQPFDATFGLEATDAVTLHHNGVALKVPSQPAIPVFDDAYPNKYWTADNPMSSVKVAGSGLKLTVKSTTSDGDFMQLRVQFTK
ncbi:putative secreted protease [Nostocoides japonicum T1-X7]|uniref:Putative secreted protease n=1 Tax=Nostocoides japonicum T1-X7 TaxID=1194083 RepID=A0A077LU41_9MICO|nr:putative secreted protease [Tetrasphaera japonica T1-X7]